MSLRCAGGTQSLPMPWRASSRPQHVNLRTPSSSRPAPRLRCARRSAEDPRVPTYGRLSSRSGQGVDPSPRRVRHSVGSSCARIQRFSAPVCDVKGSRARSSRRRRRRCDVRAKLRQRDGAVRAEGASRLDTRERPGPKASAAVPTLVWYRGYVDEPFGGGRARTKGADGSWSDPKSHVVLGLA